MDVTFYELDESSVIGDVYVSSFTYTRDWRGNRSVNCNIALNAYNVPSAIYCVAYRQTDGQWVTTSQGSYQGTVSFTAYLTGMSLSNDIAFRECAIFKKSDVDNGNFSHPYAYGKVFYSTGTLKTEEIYVGEYDYTEYFENLVSNSETQNTTLTNIKNNVQSLTEKAVSNHAILFVLFLLALTVLVERTLKGVIK